MQREPDTAISTVSRTLAQYGAAFKRPDAQSIQTSSSGSRDSRHKETFQRICAKVEALREKPKSHEANARGHVQDTTAPQCDTYLNGEGRSAVPGGKHLNGEGRSAVPGGLKVLSSELLLKPLPHTGSGEMGKAKSCKAPGIRCKSYSQALALLDSFAAFVKQEAECSAKTLRIAWISSSDSPFIPFPPALESRGFSLQQITFLETDMPQRTFHSVCQSGFFDAILLDVTPTPSLLQIARRWLKPPGAASVINAEELLSLSVRKLVIFLA